MKDKRAKLPPVHSWVEPIDSLMLVAIAEIRQVKPRRVHDPDLDMWVRRPFLYGLTAMALVDRSYNRRAARSVAEARLGMLLERHSHRLPPIGVVEGEAFTDAPG